MIILYMIDSLEKQLQPHWKSMHSITHVCLSHLIKVKLHPTIHQNSSIIDYLDNR